MKKYLLTLAVVAGVSIAAQAQTKKPASKPAPKPATAANPGAPVMKSLSDSFSYAVGLNIASNMRDQGIDQINSAMVAKAIDDVYKKKTPALASEDANRCLQTQMVVFNEKKSAANKKLAAGEIAKGRAFLNANKSNPGVVTLPDGLQYKILEPGDPNGAHPTKDDTVVVDYVGTLIDGKVFDSSERNGGPITFPLGGVIKGWTEILQLMPKGAKWKVFIPNELAYGERAMGADIPAGAALIFEITLHDIKPAANN